MGQNQQVSFCQPLKSTEALGDVCLNDVWVPWVGSDRRNKLTPSADGPQDRQPLVPSSGLTTMSPFHPSSAMSTPYSSWLGPPLVRIIVPVVVLNLGIRTLR